MHESIELFDQVVNSRYFRYSEIILFLNKSDLFKEKIQTRPLTVCFEEYTKDNECNAFDSGVNYIRSKFEERNYNPEKQIYCHVTCATDTDNVQKVFDDVLRDLVKAQRFDPC